MKPNLPQFLVCGLAAALTAGPAVAATILQSAGGTSVAFEAEENVTILTGTPTSWVITNDVTPSGSKALYASGANGTAFPASFASYQIRFATPGQYRLYFRWRANQQFTDADPNAGNSFYAPIVLNANATPVNPNPDFSISTVNNLRNRPESNTYHVDTENTALLTVSQEQVDAGQPLVFTLGTREAGFMFDRIVLSQNQSLSEAEFNATPNADTDVFVQPPGANYVAFEAETIKAKLLPGTPTSWVVTNDVTPSGSTALYASGANGTAFPSSFASYSIKFATPGVYKLFFRWRANQQFTDIDPNSGNSFYAPLVFNANATPVNPNPDFSISTVNNLRNRPESNTYHVDTENTALLTVSQEQVDAGQPLVFTLGTREAGFMFDRIVLSQDQSLSETGFNSLENTGTALPLLIDKVVGSARLTTVKVTFNKPLDIFAATATENFVLSGGISVLEAALDPVTLRDVTLTTTPQSEGVRYTLTVNDVYDLGNSIIAPNTTVEFNAWKLAPGFTRREHYFSIAGADINALVTSPKFPASPDRIDVVRGVTSSEPRVQNYGVRLTGFFIPAESGVYEFYMYNDNAAQLSLSSDASPEGLQTLLDVPTSAAQVFDPNLHGDSPATLTAGQRYFLQVLVKQSADYETIVQVAARRVGDPTPVSQLQPISGNQIGTMVDPATATLQITRQPADATVASGQRARFEAAASSPGGPAFYQWQVNGVDVPGATRAAFFTRPLSAADHGLPVQCVIHAGGAVATSAVARAFIGGSGPAVEPYIGINFVGGDAAGAAGTLRSIDVTGVVPQANFNNVSGATVANLALVDAVAGVTPVTISYTALTYFTGTGENTAEDVLFQGYLHNANANFTVTLNGVPTGVYDLYAYAVGFTYNATYEQAMSVTGAGVYPEYHVRAEHGTDYTTAPSIFRRMASVNPENREQGNYVVFRDVQPANGTLTLSVINESNNPLDIDVTPALSGLQLVRVLPSLSIQRQGNTVEVSWNAASSGLSLESSASLGGAIPASWAPVPGAGNLTGSGSISIAIDLNNPSQFYRLRR